jgi:uncharacterized coiled-coil protein SlyX
MDTKRYDPREVLERYVAALNQRGDTVIRDAAELGHPKDIIRFVLQHCMKTIADADQQEFLREAYLSLGSFQELSEEERKAVSLLAEIGPLSSPQNDLQGDQAKRIGEVAAPLQALMDRLKAELAVLLQELECLRPETNPPQQETQPGDGGPTAAPSTAGSARVAEG